MVYKCYEGRDSVCLVPFCVSPGPGIQQVLTKYLLIHWLISTIGIHLFFNSRKNRHRLLTARIIWSSKITRWSNLYSSTFSGQCHTASPISIILFSSFISNFKLRFLFKKKIYVQTNYFSVFFLNQFQQRVLFCSKFLSLIPVSPPFYHMDFLDLILDFLYS